MANIVTITEVGTSVKYKSSDGQIDYRMTGVKVHVNGDDIRIRNQYLHPADDQANVEAKFGQITENFGTSTAEEYVEYLITHGILDPPDASEVVSLPEAKKWQVVGDISYFGFAEPGTLESAALWKCMKLDETIVGDLEGKITWADNANYTQVATDLTSLTYL